MDGVERYVLYEDIYLKYSSQTHDRMHSKDIDLQQW